MAAFVVVSTFKQGTVMDEVVAVVAEERAKWWDLDVVPLGAPTVPGGAS
jgi:hypothetical protein